MSVREALAALKTAQVEGDRVVCWADLHHDAFRAAANEGRLFWRTAALHRALLEEHDDAHGTELAATAEAVARAYGDLPSGGRGVASASEHRSLPPAQS